MVIHKYHAALLVAEVILIVRRAKHVLTINVRIHAKKRLPALLMKSVMSIIIDRNAHVHQDSFAIQLKDVNISMKFVHTTVIVLRKQLALAVNVLIHVMQRSRVV